MPKKKSSKMVPKKQRFKFNIKKILKERQRDAKLSKEMAETEKQWETIDDLFQKEVMSNFGQDKDDNENPLVSPKLDHFVFDSSTYNIPFNENSYTDIKKLCSQRLLIMSIEQNELQTNIHYNHLMNAKWSPELNDVRSILHNWKIDFDSIIYKPFLKHEINNNQQVGRHNFEFVMNFITKSILRNNKFSGDDLLALAKFAITISFDRHCKELFYVIKRLFSTCIETALHKDNETDIIIYAQEFYSKYEDNLLKIISHLFLPLEGQIMRKIYTYLTFKLYKSITGQIDCIIEFPSNKEWFVQDLVPRNYFNQNREKELKSLIELLEHVVVVLDLYKNETKLSDMSDFLHSLLIQLTGLPESQGLLSILDQWKLQLFRLFVKRQIQ